MNLFANSILSVALVVGSGLTIELATASVAEAAVSSYYAVVGSGGTLNRSSGEIKSHRIKIGLYEVLFGRDVSNCSFTVTVGSPTPTTPKIPIFGIAIVAPRSGNTHGVYVTTGEPAGGAYDFGFYLNVLCP